MRERKFAPITPPVPIEAVAIHHPLGAGSDIGGIVWPQDRDVRAAGYVLVPHVRPEALDFDADEPLSSHPISLPFASVIGALFAPIPVEHR